jgi:uncharacterized RDD family membrane protein YckC
VDRGGQDRAHRGGDGGRVAPVTTAPVHGTDAWITPDAVPLDVDVATLGSRGIAYLIDLSVVLGGLLLIQLAQLLLGGGGFVPGWFGIAVLLVAAFTLQFAYPIGFEVLWRGRTPGKAVLGLRVVTAEGLPVGFRHAAIRAVVGMIDLLGTLGLVAIVSSFSSRRGQRLGDLAAGTIVVGERRATREPQAMTFPVPAGWEAVAARLEVSGLGPAERATVRDALRRAPALPSPARQQVLEELAVTLAPRVTPPPPPTIDAETWLRCVAARLAAQGGAARLAAQGGAARLAAQGGAARLATPPTPPPPPPPPPAPRPDGTGGGSPMAERDGFVPPG